MARIRNTAGGLALAESPFPASAGVPGLPRFLTGPA